MPKTTLNKCPACGRSAIVGNNGEYNRINRRFQGKCETGLCMSGPWKSSTEEAVSSWNEATAPKVDAQKLAEYLREQFRLYYGDGDLVHLEILEKFIKAGMEAQEGSNV